MGLGNSTRSGGSIVKAVDRAVDGHAYYLIQGNLEKGVANVKFVDFYYGLVPYSPVTGGDGTAEQVGSVDGFFFVRNAADGHVKGDGQGDSTVHAGWAMYIWDPQDYIKRKPATHAGWVKISQQGDVDWDITDELKAMFVLKTTFNARANEVDNRFAQDEAITHGISVRLINIENDWDTGDDVHGKAHWHENKDVLDLLSEKYQSLYYRGRPISGNSYIYDHVEYKSDSGQKEIVWCDPTLSEAEWTHDTVKNSDEIAQKLLNTEIARIGLSLFVIEVDGSVSIYKYIRGGVTDAWVGVTTNNFPTIETFDALPSNTPFRTVSIFGPTPTYGPATREAAREKLVFLLEGGAPALGSPGYECCTAVDVLNYKFAQTCVANNVGLAEYVPTLPTATKWHYKRGSWVPLQNDGVHIAGHLHKCVESDDGQGNLSYRWVDMHDDGGSVTASGAVFDLGYAVDTTLWKDVKLFWHDPDDTVEGNIPVKWAKTILVRKIGSAPRDVNDGTVVVTSVRRNEYKDTAFTDVVPFTYQNVYYRLFAVSKLGSYFANTAAIAPTKLTWPVIQDIIDRGKAGCVFEVGDCIVLPHHTVYGDIECEVVRINQDSAGKTRNGILVVAKNVLCTKVIDASEGKLSGTSVNPEWSDDFGTARGSNGAISGSYQNVVSTNIWQWLNSTETAWFSAQTPWDVAPSYATEPGFLNGFPADKLSLFLSMDAITNDGTHTKIPASRVSLPEVTGNSYFDSITKSKQLGRDKTPVEWATFSGVTSTYTETQRINYGFMTVTDNTTRGSKAPEIEVGIVPMFFLGKRS